MSIWTHSAEGRGTRRPAAGGFTFIELLVAMVFIAIVIPVAMQGLLLSNRLGNIAAHKREAARLAQQELTDLVSTTTWNTGSQSGDFGDDWPNMRWEMTAEDWIEDTTHETTMQAVTVTVYYKVQGQEYSEHLSTLVDPNATETTTGQTGVTE